MSTKRVVADGREFIYPIFKFQKQEHVNLMLENGNIHLSNVKNFRKDSYGGLIDDSREGQVSLYYQRDREANYKIYYDRHDIGLDDAFIYCGSKDFFSETLKWAILEGKETCVLITDIKAVAAQISAAIPELEYINARTCIYSGRDIGIINFIDKFRDQIAEDNMRAAWIKPKKYRQQNEFRIVWKTGKNMPSEDHINRNVSIQNYLIPVEFTNMNVLFSDNKPHTVGAKVVTVDGKSDAYFDIQYPLETFTPIIHKDGNDYFLGFLSPSLTVSGGKFYGGGTSVINGRMIACNVLLKDILRIEYRVSA